ncbi:MAG: serine hydrolase [Cyanobacteria bacterium J06634_6]
MATAYKAKILCSGIFVSGRSEASVLSEDLAADGLWPLRSLQATVDHKAQTVTVSLLSKFKSVALYRPGLGSTLVIDTTGDELRSQLSPFHPQTQKTITTTTPLPTAKPTTAKPTTAKPTEIKTDRLSRVIDDAFTESNLTKLKRTRAIVVVQHGKVIAERYAEGFTPHTPLLGWSVAKSVVNALIGILVQQGKLSVDSQDLLKAWRNPGDTRREITLNHLLQMSSGLAFSESYSNPLSDVTTMLFQRKDGAKYVAERPAKTATGQQYEYISGATVLLCQVIREVVGGSLADYWLFPRQALFNRIGMTSAVLEVDAGGTFVGSSFMYATARDWAKLGLLYLQDGQWEIDGKWERILPAGWVEYSTAPSQNADFYGAHIWRGVPNSFTSKPRSDDDWPSGAYLAAGYQGQFVTVIPDKELVVVRLGLSVRRQSWDQVQFIKQILLALTTSTR